MDKPLDKMKRGIVSIGVTGLLLSACALLSGCDDVAVPPGAKPAYGPPGAPVRGNASKPATAGRPAAASPANKAAAPAAKMPSMQTQPTRPEEANGFNPLGPIVKIEQAGNLVNLASEIIMAGVNPFMDRLPRASIVIADDGTPEPVVADMATPVDPMSSVTLLGIAYSKTTPMALIAVAGAQEGKSQLVRKGDVVLLDGAEAKIANISPESVEFQMMGPVAEKRKLALPNIVGYGATNDGVAAPVATPQNNSNPHAPPGNSGVSNNASGTVPNLPNLDKLAGNKGSGGFARTNNHSAPDVTLNEP